MFIGIFKTIGLSILAAVVLLFFILFILRIWARKKYIEIMGRRRAADLRIRELLLERDKRNQH